jgi:hypothetical protein
LKLQKRSGKDFFLESPCYLKLQIYQSHDKFFDLFFTPVCWGRLKHLHNYLCMYARRIGDYSFCLQKSVLPTILESQTSIIY